MLGRTREVGAVGSDRVTGRRGSVGETDLG